MLRLSAADRQLGYGEQEAKYRKGQVLHSRANSTGRDDSKIKDYMNFRNELIQFKQGRHNPRKSPVGT